MKYNTCSFYILFPTVLGTIGLAWSEVGIVGLQLPEKNESETRSRLRSRLDQADEVNSPEQWVADVIRRIQAHLRGLPQDFSDVPIDLRAVPNFHKLVYQAACTIPAGATQTYGDIAKKIENPQSARAVGQALGRNPVALIIPCHRVVAANGKPGGFSAFGGLSLKEKMLLAEGVSLRGCSS